MAMNQADAIPPAALSAGARPPECRPDWTLDQPLDRYTAEDHAVWRTLFERQSRLVRGRACSAFVQALGNLGLAADRIPVFATLDEKLQRATGWRIVTVPGLLPDDVFYEHLANRRFPLTWWVRERAKLDYLQEPDAFHDLFGHVPLLLNPVFADYMQAFGQGGVKALRLGSLVRLARLYWYTVEFGLIEEPEGLRIYGSGILSSKGESQYCLENSTPHRLGFDLRRVMRTRYRIDDFQSSYFVISGFEELFEATRPDFTPIYSELDGLEDIAPTMVIASDRVIHRGSVTAEE
jgi:phenylalanine-4-hydroxylase